MRDHDNAIRCKLCGKEIQSGIICASDCTPAPSKSAAEGEWKLYEKHKDFDSCGVVLEDGYVTAPIPTPTARFLIDRHESRLAALREQVGRLEKERDEDNDECEKLAKLVMEQRTALKQKDEELGLRRRADSHGLFHLQEQLGALSGNYKALLRQNAAFVAALKQKDEALRVYARRYTGYEGECWNWRNAVCDSFSGECAHFDWDGDEQDEAWQIAERALAIQPDSTALDQPK